MRVLMPFLGSRGDVQPGLALAVRLRDEGHDVVFGAPPNLAGLVRRAGFEPFAVGIDTHDLLGSELVQDGITSRNPVRLVRSLVELNTLGWQEISADLDQRAADADVLVSCLVGQEVVAAAAERHRIPLVAVHYFPVRPNRAIGLLDTAGLPGPLQGAVDRATWAATRWGWRGITRAAEDGIRRDLGLGDAHGPIGDRMLANGWPELQAVDTLLFPGLSVEWGAQRPVIGFLDLDEATRALTDPSGADDKLETWLAAGDPPVHWGFGSMRLADPAATADLIQEVTEALGLRSLISAGWSAFPVDEGVHGRCYFTGPVDHRSVLPRCAVSVHHGGAGTTAAALRAGIPSVVASFGTADQPVWGRLLRDLGVGATIPVKRLDREFLLDVLPNLLGQEAQRKAKSVAAQLITPQQSVGEAARMVEQVAAAERHRSSHRIN